MKNLGIMIIGGGTGGHISPGLALYEEFKDKKANIFFLTGKRDLRFSSIDDVLPRDLFLYDPPSFSRNIFKIPFLIIKFILAIFKVRRIITRKNIKAVIGMGGYVSGPALIAAKMKKIDIFLCEQNTVPGKVTNFFEKYAEKIYSTFPESKEYLKNKEKFLLTGNPIRKKVLTDISKSDAKKIFNLNHCKKVILIIGGSQGALQINELIYKMKLDYPEIFHEVGLIWSTGEYSYNKFNKLIQEDIESGSIYLSPYIDKVGPAYRASDLAISRSGAGVMVELAAHGIPSVLIPYPYAASNHQETNADSFVKEGGAVKILDKNISSEKFADVLGDLINNDRRLKEMADSAFSLSKVDAAEVIVNDLLDGFNKKRQESV